MNVRPTVRTYCVSLPSQFCGNAKDAGLFPIDLGGGVILRNKGDCVNYVKGFVF